MFCKYCNKEYNNTNGLKNHEIRCKNNPNRLVVNHKGCNNPMFGKTAWNKGLNKDTCDKIQQMSNTYITNERNGLHHSHSYKHKPESITKISERMKEVYANKNPELHICGRSKKGWYKGIYCQSSWELAFVIYCIDNNINFIRNNKGFKYLIDNEEHTYYPDFYLIDTNTYIEIKGYYDTKSKIKAEQFTENLLVLQKNELKDIINYVIDTYGKDYIRLYDNI